MNFTNKKLTTHDFKVGVRNNRYVIETPFDEPEEVFDFIQNGCKIKK